MSLRVEGYYCTEPYKNARLDQHSKPVVTVTRQQLLSQLGFRFGSNGPHAARTMMLDDLRALFAVVPSVAVRDDYASAVITHNLLGKPTKKSRELSLRHLATLYALEPSSALFRALRHLWQTDESAQPVLALAAALARDPLLAGTQAFILSKQPGTGVSREELEKLLSATHQERFSAASLKSFSQNVNGTWTAAGFLAGHSRKTRVMPVITPANVAFCLFLGYLEGLSGQRLFNSSWTNLLGRPTNELEAMAASASHRGLLVFMNAGGVQEVRFPGYLTAQEEQWRQEIINVI